MEHQDRFDLAKALLAWRQDCASRPGISDEDARELESDLRERVADLLKDAHSEAEAFAKAVRQMGSPGELAREFARENPFAVWRERLFWIITAGFAVSIWGHLVNGTIMWIYNTLGVLLPVTFPVWASLTGDIPILAVAVLLAMGRLQNLSGAVAGLLTSRRAVAWAGSALVLVAGLVRVFGPSPLRSGSFNPWLLALSLSLWPLLLLALSVVLFRPTSSRTTAGSGLRAALPPAAVWRERVCWIAVGGMLVGFWQTVSWLCLKALFFTGDIKRPFAINQALLVSLNLLLQFGPLILLGLFVWWRVRARKSLLAVVLLRRETMLAVVPVVLLAWAALSLWSIWSWVPRGQASLVSLAGLSTYYLTNLRWLWPVGLAALIVWLAPGRHERDQREQIVT